eukprot:2380522-Rhodomonas_salina.1
MVLCTYYAVRGTDTWCALLPGAGPDAREPQAARLPDGQGTRRNQSYATAVSVLVVPGMGVLALGSQGSVYDFVPGIGTVMPQAATHALRHAWY